MFRPGGWELIAILVLVLVLFGPKQLPKLGKMFGKTMKNVREGMEGKFEDEDDKSAEALSEANKSEAAEAKKTEEKSV